MKIAAVEAYVVKIERDAQNNNRTTPLTQDYYLLDQPLSVIYSRKNETVLVKIVTDEGITGWGEALVPTNPEVVFSLIQTGLAPAIIGWDPIEHETIQNRLYNMYRVRGYEGGFLQDAMSAIDIALWDIKGKAFHQPCYKLMGGSDKERVALYMSANRGASPRERIEDIRRCFDEGITAYKLHALDCGWRGVAQVLEAVRADYAPDRYALMHDGHWNYTLPEALKLGSVIDALDMDFYECPLAPEDMEGYAELAARLKTPVAAGESIRGVQRFKQWIDRKAVRFLQPDVGRVGMTDYLKIALLAEAAGLQTGPHLSVHQSVGVMASVHLAFAVRSTKYLEYQPLSVKTARVFSDFDFVISDGALQRPTQVGLGVDISEKSLALYTTQHARIQ